MVAGVAGATAARAQAVAGEGDKRPGTEDGEGVEWAWPSQHHAGVDTSARFRQERRFRRRREEWDLPRCSRCGLRAKARRHGPGSGHGETRTARITSSWG